MDKPTRAEQFEFEMALWPGDRCFTDYGQEWLPVPHELVAFTSAQMRGPTLDEAVYLAVREVVGG